jgi:adenine-specific DNA methylase
VEQLAVLADREGRRPVPIYHAHRWFARRFSSAFRAILVAARLRRGADFWKAFYEGVSYSGLTVLDPFVGGGTSVVEAARLGASTIGVDIDPVACAITRFELAAADAPDLGASLANLQTSVGKRLDRYYRTRTTTGAVRRVLHAFWVQVVRCRSCRLVIEAHPHYQLAYEAEGERQWAFCRNCRRVHELGRDEKSFRCQDCQKNTVIEEGVVDYGELVCPACAATERLIDVAARMSSPPDWRLFALETVPLEGASRRCLMSDRTFQAATDEDRERVGAARRALLRRRTADGLRWVPQRAIPTEGRADDRLLDYGYRHYHDLFNPRQLLHLSVLAEAIASTEGRERDALALAFSDHLTTNCMQTHYAFGWRRLAPLFSIRAYRHVTRPVEINPWLDGTGRGTFPNTVRQVQRAIDFARNPTLAHLDGGFIRSGSFDTNGDTRVILNADSRDLAGVTDRSVDLILTDPPFFDNIAYAELSDFFLPWLEAQGLVATSGEGPACLPPNLASRTRDEEGYNAFRRGLADCFIQMRRVLKDDGRLVFSYQHRTSEGWDALAYALACGGWLPVQIFPMLGNSSSGLHRHEGTIMWDAVTVCSKGRVRAVDRLSAGAGPAAEAVGHARSWAARLSALKGSTFRNADRANLQSAALVAAALGMFGGDNRSGSRPLRELLAEISQVEG